MGNAASPNKSLKSDNLSAKEKLDKQMKEIEEKKAAAEKALREAQANPSKKSDPAVAISA